MAFEHVTALYALPLAAAPIIIHLLNRRRFKVLEWAAMEFLLASSRRNYRRIRLEQLILLLLRTLLIILLIFMIARPKVRRGPLAGSAEQRRFVLLVLDTSMSMGYRDGSLSSYDRGLGFAKDVVGSLRKGDSWALVAAQGAGRVIVGEPSVDLDAARGAVTREGLRLSDAGGSVAGVLEACQELVERAQKPNKEVYIITDMQRVSWLASSGSAAAEHVARARELSKAAAVAIVDVGAETPTNLAVTELGHGGPLAVAGGEAVLRVRVANSGPALAADVTVDLLVDGFKQQRTASRDIAPGASGEWELRHVFRRRGFHEVAAELQADNLARDDRRFLALAVRESVRVLCVDGEPGADLFSGETDYLRQALRPGGERLDDLRETGAADRLSLFDPEAVTIEGFTPSELPRYDAVVLANVPHLDDEPRKALERYVREGGALLVFLGDRVDPDLYNRSLYREGKGLLPCSLGEVVGEGAERRNAVHISGEMGRHPFTRLFREQKAIKLTSPFFFRYWRLEGVDGRDDVRVVCRFDGGAPAMVEATHGRGRVVVFASSADDEWNDMPSWPAYLALMQETTTQVARDPGARHNLTVGQPLVAHLSPRQFGKALHVVKPGPEQAEPVVVQATAADGIVSVTYRETDRAGVYKVTPKDKAGAEEEPDEPDRAEQLFAVNVPARESDLTRISEQELRKVYGGFDFEYRRGAARRERAAEVTRGGELWRGLAYALLALVLLESVLAQRFGR